MYISSNPWLFANWIDIPWCAFVKTPQNTLGTGGDCQGCGSLVLTTIHWYAHSINFYIHIHFAHLRFNLDLGGDFKYFFNFIPYLGKCSDLTCAYSFRWVEWNHQLEIHRGSTLETDWRLSFSDSGRHEALVYRRRYLYSNGTTKTLGWCTHRVPERWM